MLGELSRDYLLRCVHYDPESGQFTWKVGRKKARAGGKAGSVKPHGYEVIGINYARYYSHRLAWLYMTGEWPKEQIDHINGDRGDNRFQNLRLATHGENQRNRGRQINNQSGTPGVHWSNREQRWVAKIKIDSKTHQIGVFADLSAAVGARKLAEQRHFGSFTRKGEDT